MIAHGHLQTRDSSASVDPSASRMPAPTHYDYKPSNRPDDNLPPVSEPPPSMQDDRAPWFRPRACNHSTARKTGDAAFIFAFSLCTPTSRKLRYIPRIFINCMRGTLCGGSHSASHGPIPVRTTISHLFFQVTPHAVDAARDWSSFPVVRGLLGFNACLLIHIYLSLYQCMHVRSLFIPFSAYAGSSQ